MESRALKPEGPTKLTQSGIRFNGAAPIQSQEEARGANLAHPDWVINQKNREFGIQIEQNGPMRIVKEEQDWRPQTHSLPNFNPNGTEDLADHDQQDESNMSN